ncbi:hypothetical protein CDAR_532041 [Caerostris darwini]|uniref:Vitellogenin n=1 Tax=Caerostris darwini TaxID=1538125 RepID=A0AAV4R2V9_9ARAC|nr:hypothetical protein CDAR_532041 [Caerostris darwini]
MESTSSIFKSQITWKYGASMQAVVDIDVASLRAISSSPQSSCGELQHYVPMRWKYAVPENNLLSTLGIPGTCPVLKYHIEQPTQLQPMMLHILHNATATLEVNTGS